MRSLFLGLYGRRSNPFVSVPLAIGLMLMVGATGYLLIGTRAGARWSFFDCLYMAVISLTTTGYGETLAGFAEVPFARPFTAGFLLFGYGVVVWAFSTLTAAIVEGRFTEALGKKRMQQTIARLSDHLIVCGLGEAGLHVVEEMRRTMRDVVVIERDPERIGALEGGVPFVLGDADEDATLVAAGIERARGLAACLPEDKDNLFLALTARELNPSLRIVCRAVHDASREKLLRAGADAIVATNQIGGLRLASELTRPHVVTFLDAMMRSPDHAVRIEELTVPVGSPLIGRTVEQVDFRSYDNLLLLAAQGDGDTFLYNPLPGYVLAAGKTLIVLGTAQAVQALRAALK